MTAPVPPTTPDDLDRQAAAAWVAELEAGNFFDDWDNQDLIDAAADLIAAVRAECSDEETR